MTTERIKISFPQQLLVQLRTESKRSGIPMAEIVRRAVDDFFLFRRNRAGESLQESPLNEEEVIETEEERIAREEAYAKGQKVLDEMNAEKEAFRLEAEERIKNRESLYLYGTEEEPFNGVVYDENGKRTNVHTIPPDDIVCVAPISEKLFDKFDS